MAAWAANSTLVVKNGWSDNTPRKPWQCFLPARLKIPRLETLGRVAVAREVAITAEP